MWEDFDGKFISLLDSDFGLAACTYARWCSGSNYGTRRQFGILREETDDLADAELPLSPHYSEIPGSNGNAAPQHQVRIEAWIPGNSCALGNWKRRPARRGKTEDRRHVTYAAPHTWTESAGLLYKDAILADQRLEQAEPFPLQLPRRRIDLHASGESVLGSGGQVESWHAEIYMLPAGWDETLKPLDRISPPGGHLPLQPPG
ncbi:hypothetical protein PG987_013654 [Apiospora arundinis]